MSDEELNRSKITLDVCDRRLRRIDAASVLNLSERQVQRLMSQFRGQGFLGLTHKARGKQSNNHLPYEYRTEILQIINQHYSDFSLTFAHEKLKELHNLIVSVETLRKWMIADGLWVPHSQRKPHVYQPRYRLGELIQIDGSHHDWFEGRSLKCCLLVYIDDATGRLMNLRFSYIESAFDYMVTTREYLNEHGKPVDFYSEKQVIISLFMDRKLSENHKLSSKTLKKQFEVYSYRCIKPVNNRNFANIGDIYEYSSETKQTKNVQFIFNQLIHGQAMYAYRDETRNWHGVFTCSDFERNKYIYRIPTATIIDILDTAANDYPEMVSYRFCNKKNDYIVENN